MPKRDNLSEIGENQKELLILSNSSAIIIIIIN